MPPKHLWNKLRAYGRGFGLSDEDADDFAQDAYIRILTSNNGRISYSFVLADFFREKLGRPGRPRHRAEFVYLDETATGHADLNHSVIEGPQGTDMLALVREILVEAESRGMKRWRVMMKLARYFGVTPKQMKDMLSGVAS